MPDGQPERPMTSREVARLFAVSDSTVSRWAEEGKIRGFRTPGGHWRFQPADITAALEAGGHPTPSIGNRELEPEGNREL